MKNAQKLALRMIMLRSRFQVGRPAKQPRRQRQWGARSWLMSIMLPIAGSLVLVSLSLAAVVNTKLNGTLVSGGDVSGFQVGPDSSQVVYRADQDTHEVAELYSVPLAGGSAPVKLNGTLVSGGNVGGFQVSPDSSQVVYLADQDTDEVFELYSVPLAGGSAPVKLNGTLVSGGNVRKYFQVSPDSSRVVYQADQDTHEVWELYSVPLAGGSTPVKLNGILISGGDVWWFQVSLDSSRVVYLADQHTNEVRELYSVPLAGGSAPVKLNGTLVSGGAVLGFQVSPDSSKVVYLADQDTDEVYELYSVPLAGGSAPVKLNGTLVSGGDVDWEFQVSPDSSRVIYLADQDTNGVDELYSVPLAGGSAPVKLNGTLVSGGAVLGFQVSPDSSWVVYQADQDTNEVDELYSVPLAGGSAPVKLNGTLVSGGAVGSDFQVSPDSNRVVYTADQDTDEVPELYSVPLAGGSAPVKLNGTLVSGGNVGGFQVSSDSSRVVYLADQDTDEVFELYSVPLAGGSAPVKLNGTLVSGGDVDWEFQVSPDSSRVVYTADQDMDKVRELYVSYDESLIAPSPIYLPIIVKGSSP